ncbi:MAG: serine/threonine protein kinase [Polyangiaceae bacterium]|nr:serine/threonine protein kinase [Polyangiaceae bacterium]
MAAPEPDRWLGALVDGRYRVDRIVGRGGSGAVYEALHVSLEHKVAFKVLDLDASPGAIGDEARSRRQDRIGRFLEEGRIATRLKHPNIAAAFDVGLYEGAPYLVMEWCDGQSLREFLAARADARLSLEEALAIVVPVTQALEQAHAQGVVHRDIKPANIMLDRSSGTVRPKIVDFGIAKLMPEASHAGSGETLTISGESPRTPAYAAPEQIAGARTGPWTDVHAVGLLFVELVTGQLPYESESANLAVIDPIRPSAAARGVDVGPFEAVIARAVSLRPSDRFEDAAALATALADAASSSGTSAGEVRLPSVPADAPKTAAPVLLLAHPETDRTAPPSSHTLRTGIGYSAAPPSAGSRPSRRLIALLGAALVASAGAAAFALGVGRPRDKAPPAPTEEAAAPAPSESSQASAAPSAPAAPIVPKKLSDLSADMLEKRIASLGVRTAGNTTHDAAGAAMRAVTIGASDTEWGIAFIQESNPATPEDQRKSIALMTVEQFVFSSKKPHGYAIDKQGTVLVVQYPGNTPPVSAIRDAIAQGIELDVAGDTIGGPDPVLDRGLPLVPLTARRLRDLSPEELNTRIRKKFGRTVIHGAGVPLTIQVKVGEDMGTISLYTSGADGLVKVMRTSGERIGYAVDGDVFIMSRGTGPFATREVLAEVLDRLAKAESMGTLK